MKPERRDPVVSRAELWALAGWAALACTFACGDTDEPRAVGLLSINDGRMSIADGDDRAFLIDTGAPRTIIRPEVLGLPPGTFAERPVPVADWSDRAGLNDGMYFCELSTLNSQHIWKGKFIIE